MYNATLATVRSAFTSIAMMTTKTMTMMTIMTAVVRMAVIILTAHGVGDDIALLVLMTSEMALRATTVMVMEMNIIMM